VKTLKGSLRILYRSFDSAIFAHALVVTAYFIIWPTAMANGSVPSDPKLPAFLIAMLFPMAVLVAIIFDFIERYPIYERLQTWLKK
jgi:hypothetical protein